MGLRGDCPAIPSAVIGKKKSAVLDTSGGAIILSWARHCGRRRILIREDAEDVNFAVNESMGREVEGLALLELRAGGFPTTEILLIFAYKVITDCLRGATGLQPTCSQRGQYLIPPRPARVSLERFELLTLVAPVITFQAQPRRLLQGCCSIPWHSQPGPLNSQAEGVIASQSVTNTERVGLRAAMITSGALFSSGQRGAWAEASRAQLAASHSPQFRSASQRRSGRCGSPSCVMAAALRQPSNEELRQTKLITAIKTPYLANGKFDLPAFDRIVQHQVRSETLCEGRAALFCPDDFPVPRLCGRTARWSGSGGSVSDARGATP